MSPLDFYNIMERHQKFVAYVDYNHQRADYVAQLRDDIRALIAYVNELERRVA